MLNPLKAICDPRNWNMEHYLKNRTKSDHKFIVCPTRMQKFILHKIPNTAYWPNTAYIVTIIQMPPGYVYWNINACTNNIKIINSPWVWKGRMLSKRWNAVLLPTLSETSDGIHTLRSCALKHSRPLSFNHSVFQLLRRKVLLHNEASHVHCFNTMIDPCQCLLLKLTLTIYA